MKLYKTVPGHQCGVVGGLEEYKANEEAVGAKIQTQWGRSKASGDGNRSVILFRRRLPFSSSVRLKGDASVLILG